MMRSPVTRSTDAPSVAGQPVEASGASRWPCRRRWHVGAAHLGPMAVAAFGYAVGRWPGSTAAVAVWALAPRISARRRSTRARRRLGATLADVLELAARGVRTGVAPDAALRDAAALVGPPVVELVGELVRGVGAGDPTEATRRWANLHDDPAVSVVAATVGLVAGRGGGAARGFEAAANVLRERDRRARDAEAWAAQSKASATLLVGAPLVLAVGALAVDPSRAGRVLAEPIALACVVAGAACELVGAWWMSRLLVDASEPRS